jgi:hypothetical protein
MISTELFEDDTLVIDGNPNHITEGTILLLGKVSHAKRNVTHSHIPICVGVVSTGEEAKGVSCFLLEVMSLRKKPFETLLWRVDGHGGLRLGITQAVATAQEMYSRVSRAPVIAMDEFHMLQAVMMHVKLLPTKMDVSSALRDIKYLADIPVMHFEKACDAVMATWITRPGWDKFREYFHGTWVISLPGWWGDVLGEGSPRTTGGAEGRWPAIHRLLEGRRPLSA